ncbi:MAG TPA: IPT/TIG domain-containing protein [Planctomycetota bacterium]|nr:IPT/TIG domain-containing protein [Planctomycetota bacterium]
MRTLFISTLLPLLGAAGEAQQQISGSASSQTYFLVAAEWANGEETNTLLYNLRPSQGNGLVVEPISQSSTYVILGGFPAMLSATVIGRPWLTGVSPFYVPQFGNPQLTLHGTEMWLGGTPTVAIGGQNATVNGRTADTVLITMPGQPVPGLQPVQVTNNLGTTTLNEGVGVLPMLELREPLNGTDPNRIRYHGSPIEIVVLGIGQGLAPTPVVFPGFGYSLQLDPNTVVLTVAYLTDAEGRVDIPLSPFPSGIFRVQALVFTNNPGYYPGSWTNQLPL